MCPAGRSYLAIMTIVGATTAPTLRRIGVIVAGRGGEAKLVHSIWRAAPASCAWPPRAAQKPLRKSRCISILQYVAPLMPQLKGKKHVVCVLIRPGYRRSNDSGMFVRGPCVRSYTAPDSIKYVLCSYTASVQPLHRPCCSWRLRTNHSVKAHRS